MHEPPSFRPLGLLAGAILPGLGHVVCGERKRGLFAGAGVLGLFFGGMFIGGIGVVDRQAEPIWFVGQALVGPVAFGVDALHQNRYKVIDTSSRGLPIRRPAYPTEGRNPDTGFPVEGGTPPYVSSIGKVREIGILYATLAGMMNLIVLLDAAIPGVRGKEKAAS